MIIELDFDGASQARSFLERLEQAWKAPELASVATLRDRARRGRPRHGTHDRIVAGTSDSSG